MSWADLLLVIVLGSFAVSGAYRGLTRQVIGALGLALSLVVAARCYLPLAELLRGSLHMPMASELVAFAMLVVLVWSATDLAGILLCGKGSDADRAWPNVLGGTLVGLLTGILLLAALIAGLGLLGTVAGEQLAASHIGGWLLGLAQRMIALAWGI